MNPYGFVVRDPDSSVYKAVCRYLLEKRLGDWKKLPPKSTKFHLLFGERNNICFGRLGHEHGLAQLVNYYRGSDCITRKSMCVKVFQEYYEQSTHSYPCWLPLTFRICPKNVEMISCRNGTSVLRPQKPDDTDELIKTSVQVLQKEGKPVVWIAKSNLGTKGEGIRISPNVTELLDYINDENKSYVVQRYIENPFLLHGGRKFDIRCWVLLDANYHIYLYPDGVLRTASETYKPHDYYNTTSHLTNHCLQKELSTNFGHFEEGNEMFFDEFDRYLRKTRGTSLDVMVMPQIKDIIRTCFQLIDEKINAKGLGYKCFQLFGFDFILDDDLKVWLIEVNGAPACAEFLLPNLVRSIVQTAIDPIYPPSVPPTGDSAFIKISH